jgi:hypothetical protein
MPGLGLSFVVALVSYFLNLFVLKA